MEERIENINARCISAINYFECEDARLPFFQMELKSIEKKNCNSSFAYSYEPSDNFDRSRTKKRLMDDMITIGLSITYNMAIKVIIDGNGVYGRREVKEVNIIK